MIKASTRPMVSVVIPHYGGQDILTECLLSLKSCEYSNLEIIVVDNNSYDISIKEINKIYSDIKIVKSKYNRGFAGGCNLGAQESNGEYILILNNDTIHQPDWINFLVHKMEMNKSISSIQPKIKNYYNRNLFDYAGASGGFMDKYCFPFARGRIFGTLEKDKGQYDNACKIFWASGTAFITRKKIFEEIGGFDEILFAHMEEIDYHWKSQLLGYEVWVEPKSIIYHKGAMTLPVSSPKKTYLNYRNSMILLLTNYPISKSILLLFPRIIFEFLSILKEIFTFKWKHAYAIFKSWNWIIKNYKIIQERRLFHKRYNNKKMELIFQKSLVINYYLRGKKYFNTIYNN